MLQEYIINCKSTAETLDDARSVHYILTAMTDYMEGATCVVELQEVEIEFRGGPIPDFAVGQKVLLQVKNGEFPLVDPV